MENIGPIQKEFMERSYLAMKEHDSPDDYKDVIGTVFREALDAINYLEHRDEELISEVRIMTTVMQNILGIKEGEREEIELDDGSCSILIEAEARARFVNACIAVMKCATNNSRNPDESQDS